MKILICLLYLVAICGITLGCDPKPPGKGPAHGEAGHHHVDGDDHGHDHDDHDHDHDHEGEDGHKGEEDHHGESLKLGNMMLGKVDMEINQHGKMKKEAKELSFEISLTAKSEVPVAVRCWLGTEDAKGTRKEKAEYSVSKKNYHIHVAVPEGGLTEKNLWLEVQLEGGKRERKSIAFASE